MGENSHIYISLLFTAVPAADGRSRAGLAAAAHAVAVPSRGTCWAVPRQPLVTLDAAVVPHHSIASPGEDDAAVAVPCWLLGVMPWGGLGTQACTRTALAMNSPSLCLPVLSVAPGMSPRCSLGPGPFVTAPHQPA